MAQQNIEQSGEIYAVIQAMAKEQMQFLEQRYKMSPREIIHLYTGKKLANASYQAALHSIIAHRLTAELVPGRIS